MSPEGGAAARVVLEQIGGGDLDCPGASLGEGDDAVLEGDVLDALPVAWKALDA